MKNAFERRKQIIENKHFEDSKKYIKKYISNVFLKEFEVEREKKIEFKISLINYMKNFTQEFMNFCQGFLNSFKSNTDKIVLEFDIKEIEPIEHINIIAIGKIGIGKSTLINECLLLPENKRAKEGKGLSVTSESNVYISDKLNMIRMWDTQGLDDKVSRKDILNEIKRLVDMGLDKGPDYYINIILYCTTGFRFQNEDGQLIYDIMKIYPLDNLPVVITQLQSFDKDEAKQMEKIIRGILNNYLEHQIVEKIEIKNVVARDKEIKDAGVILKAYGIPELLKLTFDIMGRSISSATCDRISKNIKKLCKDFMDKKIAYVQNLFNNEMEILEVAKSLFIIDQEKDIDDNHLDDENEKELSELNIYKNIENQNYFVDNFITSMRDKFINIFNNIETGNMPLDNKEENENDNNHQENNNVQNNINENIQNEQEKNIQNENEINNQENNNIQNNINENIQNEQEENIQNENEINNQENNNIQNNINENVQNEQEENIQNENENIHQEEQKEEENKEEERKNDEEKENIEEEKEQMEDKSAIVTFIEESLEQLKKNLDSTSNKVFEKIFKEEYNKYLEELLKEQKIKNEDFKDNRQLMDISEIEKNYRDILFIYFKNEYFKIFFCIILKLFMNNLKEIFDMIVKKELTDNKDVLKIINEKAENSLKDITENLKNKLIAELDGSMKKNKDVDNNPKKKNEFDNEDIDFAFGKN